MAIPSAAAVPAIPTKWPLPMLLAKRDAPICGVHSYMNNVLHLFDNKKAADKAFFFPLW